LYQNDSQNGGHFAFYNFLWPLKSAGWVRGGAPYFSVSALRGKRENSKSRSSGFSGAERKVEKPKSGKPATLPGVKNDERNDEQRIPIKIQLSLSLAEGGWLSLARISLIFQSGHLF
jgi:hypothetical protein